MVGAKCEKITFLLGDVFLTKFLVDDMAIHVRLFLLSHRSLPLGLFLIYFSKGFLLLPFQRRPKEL